MREIPLTQGKVAIVDDDMYDFLNQWNWCVNPSHGKDGLRVGVNAKTDMRD